MAIDMRTGEEIKPPVGPMTNEGLQAFLRENGRDIFRNQNPNGELVPIVAPAVEDAESVNVGLLADLEKRAGIAGFNEAGMLAYRPRVEAAVATAAGKLADKEGAVRIFEKKYGSAVAINQNVRRDLSGATVEKDVIVTVALRVGGADLLLDLKQAVLALRYLDGDINYALGYLSLDLGTAAGASTEDLAAMESGDRPALSLQAELDQISRNEEQAEYDEAYRKVKEYEDAHRKALDAFNALILELEARVAGLDLKISRATDPTEIDSYQQEKAEVLTQISELKQQRALEHARDIYNPETKPFIPQLDGF